jgi:hypothetical protein
MFGKGQFYLAARLRCAGGRRFRVWVEPPPQTPDEWVIVQSRALIECYAKNLINEEIIGIDPQVEYSLETPSGPPAIELPDGTRFWIED